MTTTTGGPGLRAGQGGGKKVRESSPPVPREQTVKLGELPLADLRRHVAHNISLQTEDISSPIDQRKLLKAIRVDVRTKNLAEASIANSRVDSTTGKHLCGCPCKYCVALEDTL